MDLFKTKSLKLTAMTAAVALLALGATQAWADGVNGGSANGSVTVAVDNTVTVTETQPINFGSMVIITDGGIGGLGNVDVIMDNAGAINWPNIAGDVAPWVPALGAASIYNGTSKARAFPTGAAAATPGIYTITGVAFGASMGIIYNNTDVGNTLVFGTGDEVSMVCAACLAGAEPAMVFGAITDDTVGGIATDGDNDGTIVVNTGGTLRTPNVIDSSNLTGSAVAVAGALQDGSYTGAFVVSAIY